MILLDRGLERKKLKSAYDNDKGFSEIFRVNVKDQSIDVDRVVCSVQNQTGFVRGVNEVNGNIRSENNELKIRFSSVYAQILLMQFLNTPEKLWNWLTGKETPPDSYPKSKELKQALNYSDGGFYLTGSGNEITIFSGRSSFDAVHETLMEPGIFRTIRNVTRRTYLKDGFEIKIQRERLNPAISIQDRVTVKVCDMRDIVKLFHGDDKWRRVDEPLFNDRWYIALYSTTSLVEIYAKRWSNSNLFYNWTTSYQDGGWKLGHDFRESERHSDFDDIQKLINGDMPSGRIIDSNSNFVFHNFLVMVQESLQLRTDVSVQFDVFYNGWGHNKYWTWFGEGNNPWL